MKEFVLGLLISLAGLTGHGYALMPLPVTSSHLGSQSPFSITDSQKISRSSKESGLTATFNTVDLLQKGVSSYSQRGPRGHRGPKGHRGHTGKRGAPGVSGSTVFDRAYLLAPAVKTPVVLYGSEISMIVPFELTDLNSPIFDKSQNRFIVSESGVYQISYFVKAIRVDESPSFPVTTDTSGLVMGLVIDANLLEPIGLRSLPLVNSANPISETGTVWGTHQIFVRLHKEQCVQLAVLADPSIGGNEGVTMQFVKTGALTDEVAYLSILKVGS